MDKRRPHDGHYGAAHLAATLRARREEMASAAGARIGDSEIVHQLTTRMWAGATGAVVTPVRAGREG